MAIKYLNGAYPAGYSLKPTYSGLMIDATATVGRTGVSASLEASVGNLGKVQATSGNGVDLKFGGVVANGSSADTGALISGYDGVADTSNLATVTNFGTIQGGSGANQRGVYLESGGTITNGSAADATALIEGASAVYASAQGAATVTNFGTIEGTGFAAAVSLAAAGDRFVAEAGSAVWGMVEASGGTLELAGGAGTILNLGAVVRVTGAVTANVSGFGSYVIDQGSSWILAGANTLAAADKLVDNGTVSMASSASLTNAGAISGAGVLELTGGATTFGAGTSLTVAKISESWVATTASFAAPSLTYAGVWSQAGGTVSASSGDRVNFTGVGDSFAGTLTGAGTIAFIGGSDTLTGTTVSAKSVIINTPAVTLGGTIDLTTTLTATTKDLTIATGGATLTGGGALMLTNLATNTVVGASGSATLTNEDKIKGAGQLGDGSMTLDNAAGGTIEGIGSVALTINTGGNTITNAGFIDALGPGGVIIIASALDNTGVLVANPGALTVNGAVTGSGHVNINGGRAVFTQAFNENVTFTGSKGVLELSQAYSGKVTGLSAAGANAIVLLDLAFKGATAAAYSGTATSGVLTVKEGTSTATIHLIGDYTSASFILSQAAGGGTQIVEPAKQSPSAAPTTTRQFIAAMAGFGVSAGGSAGMGGEVWRTTPPQLVAPRALA